MKAKLLIRNDYSVKKRKLYDPLMTQTKIILGNVPEGMISTEISQNFE